MPNVVHILKHDSCSRARALQVAAQREHGGKECVERAEFGGGALAGVHVHLRRTRGRPGVVGEILFSAAMLLCHIRSQSLSPNRSEHFSRYS